MAGLIAIAEGMLRATDANAEVSILPMGESVTPHSAPAYESLNIDLFTEDSVLEFGYCTEIMLRLQRAKTDVDNFNVNIITDYLKSIGDSIVCFKTGSIVKLHVHTMTPDKVLALCQKYGEFLKVKVENMSLQHNNTIDRQEAEHKAYGVVVAASGEGIKQTFKFTGVAHPDLDYP